MIKFYFPISIVKIAGIFLCAIAICSCEGKPERKKLPDFTYMDGWEEMPLTKKDMQPPFYVYDTSFSQNGKMIDFFSIAIPDAVQDSIVLRIASSYEPFVPALMQQWSKQNGKGILIDMRTGNTDWRRADFIIKKNPVANFDMLIPLSIVWDRPSDYRADYFMKIIISLPEIKCTLISDSRQKEGIERNDCFSPTEPGFDQQ